MFFTEKEEKAAWLELEKLAAKVDLQANVLKVSHHGSKNGLLIRFYSFFLFLGKLLRGAPATINIKMNTDNI